MQITEITSIDDPRVAGYANIRDAELAQRADPLDESVHRGLFVAEGELVVRRLIGSHYRTVSVLTTRTRLASLGDVLTQLPDATPVYLVDQPAMNSIVGFNIHRGLLAIGARTGMPSLTQVLARRGPFLILEDLVNHDNLGGIFRNAACLGGAGVAVVLSPRCADPLYRKSLRVSIGHVLSVPFVRLADWEAGLLDMTEAGVRLWALSPRPDARPLREAAVAVAEEGARVGLMLGSEGPGLTGAAFGRAGAWVRVPMRPASPDRDIDSLNVGMAAGIALYELGLGSGGGGNRVPPGCV